MPSTGSGQALRCALRADAFEMHGSFALWFLGGGGGRKAQDDKFVVVASLVSQLRRTSRRAIPVLSKMTELMFIRDSLATTCGECACDKERGAGEEEGIENEVDGIGH